MFCLKKYTKSDFPGVSCQLVVANVFLRVQLKTQSFRELTISGSNTLTLSREIKCFTNCHFTNMKIMLANVRCRFLGHKFVLCMSIERDLPLDLQSNAINMNLPIILDSEKLMKWISWCDPEKIFTSPPTESSSKPFDHRKLLILNRIYHLTDPVAEI